jgi:hypothetical protein
MRIMTILGSPRRQGNTAKVLGWIEEQFRADGHEVDSVAILDYRVQGCGECMACKKGTVELCSIGDDANGLYRRMVAADLVIPGFQQLVEWLKGRMAGHWFVGGCTLPEAIGDEVKARMAEFARLVTKGAN